MDQVDVLVVGAGNAALTAALSAAESNVNVLVLEKAPKEERGGNTAFTGGVFRHAHNGKPDIMKLVDSLSQKEWEEIEISPFPPEELYKEVMRITQGKADPVLSRTWINESYNTVLWMKEKLGIKFVFNDVFTLTDLGVKKFRGPAVLMAEGKGIGLSTGLFRKCENTSNITIQYRTQVKRLLVEAGKVQGVVASVNGASIEIRAKSVVLASGGFEASQELRMKFMGDHWSKAKVRGTKYNTGETLLAAIEAGASTFGDLSDCHATPIDARSPDYGTLELTDKTARYSWMFGILVNKEGKRFVDEGEDFGDLVYAKLGKIILTQRDATAYQIFDKKTLHLLEKRYSTFPPITAQFLDELSGKIDIDIDQLKKTVEEFNRNIDTTKKFDPTIKDGRATRNINPPKSNWAQSIDEAPFVVYPVTCGITFTFGGIKVNEKAQVISKNDSPIQGLYAAGEITGGFFYHNYPGGAGLMRGAVFGKIAGAEAASFAKLH